MSNRPNDWSGLTLADGRYRITAKLGEGGMGVVYRARDRNLDADVVIKVPRRAMLDDPEFAHRFAREIRSLVKLSHPCIVKVTDVGECDGLPFAVMQYLPGGSLEDRQAITADGQRAALEPRTVAGWLTGVAAALDYIHSQGFVHRDVKPGNILFDAQGHALLSDFGVAKTLASVAEVKSSKTAATGAGLVLGTPVHQLDQGDLPAVEEPAERGDVGPVQFSNGQHAQPIGAGFHAIERGRGGRAEADADASLRASRASACRCHSLSGSRHPRDNRHQ